MNKAILSIIFSVIFFFLTSENSYSQQCPQNHTPRTVNVSVGDCVYEVELCVYCGISFPVETSVISITLIPQTPPCTPNYNIFQVVNQVYLALNNPQFFNQNICSSSQAPFCPNQSQEYTFRYDMCWKVTKIPYLGTTVPKYTPCGDNSYCTETFTLCRDPFTGLLSKTITNESTTGINDCDLEGFDVQIYESLPVGESTDCFIYDAPCND